MKITVPGFVMEEHVQEAMKRFAAKEIAPNETVVAAVATTIGLLEKLGPDAANAAGTLPDIVAGELEEIDPRTVLPLLTEEQLKFMQEDATSRGMRLKFTSKDLKFASDAAELVRVHPKKEISITLPDETQ
jgi:hypothetical protein